MKNDVSGIVYILINIDKNVYASCISCVSHIISCL